MRRATQTDVPAILVYLKRYVTDCIYMYIDLKKYGIDNPNITVWMDSDETGIKSLVVKYYTGLNIFAHGEHWNAEDTVKIATEQNVLSIHGPKRMIEALAPFYSQEAEIEYGEIYEFTNERQYEIDKEIELASVDDVLEIANLVVTDEGIGSHYEVSNLAAQLKERMETQMGRSYVIRDNGKIIAHIASYAEFDHIATISGLIVDKNYRSNIYGAAIEAHIVKVLRDEGFHVYSYVITRLRKKLLAALGNKKVAEYGKIVRKPEKHSQLEV